LRKDLEKELIKQVKICIGRKPYLLERVYWWVHLKHLSDVEVLEVLVQANNHVYLRKRFLGR
jgi:hypothetical protein